MPDPAPPPVRWGVMSLPTDSNEKLRRALDAGWEPFAVDGGYLWLRKAERADA